MGRKKVESTAWMYKALKTTRATYIPPASLGEDEAWLRTGEEEGPALESTLSGLRGGIGITGDTTFSEKEDCPPANYGKEFKIAPKIQCDQVGHTQFDSGVDVRIKVGRSAFSFKISLLRGGVPSLPEERAEDTTFTTFFGHFHIQLFQPNLQHALLTTSTTMPGAASL